jgi:uncharacterized membrane protein YfcA
MFLKENRAGLHGLTCRAQREYVVKSTRLGIRVLDVQAGVTVAALPPSTAVRWRRDGPRGRGASSLALPIVSRGSTVLHLSSLTLTHFSLQTAVWLFLAAMLGGALNAVAGGGSFIAFPALLFSGVPPVPANATNTVALWTGLVFSGGAFRSHLNVRMRVILALLIVSVLGGIFGAILLIRTPAHTFLRVLPWLMLSATLLFIFGRGIRRAAQAVPESYEANTRAILFASFFQLLVAIYGGYFGGGMGIVILAMLTAFGMANIHAMNALKTVLSSATNGVAVIVFIFAHAVYWPQALVMIGGAAVGGYFGARYSLRLPQAFVRAFVIAIGTGMTIYFFIRAYRQF